MRPIKDSLKAVLRGANVNALRFDVHRIGTVCSQIATPSDPLGFRSVSAQRYGVQGQYTIPCTDEVFATRPFPEAWGLVAESAT